MREIEGKLSFKCPFCRRPVPREKRFRDKQKLKRIEANDPVALYEEGIDQYQKGDYRSAFGYLMKAAEVGELEAHRYLSLLYHNGEGVEKDRGKEIHHLEEAAIGGHPVARYNLGAHEWNNDNNERAVKHWIIAAKLGHDLSIKALMNAFKRGMISKEEFAATLRANQAAVDATKSPQREAAEEFHRNAA
jgi:TPR repeat protein